jgi:hypothetical protein
MGADLEPTAASRPPDSTVTIEFLRRVGFSDITKNTLNTDPCIKARGALTLIETRHSAGFSDPIQALCLAPLSRDPETGFGYCRSSALQNGGFSWLAVILKEGHAGVERDEWIITAGREILNQLPPDQLTAGEQATFDRNARHWLAHQDDERKSRSDVLGWGAEEIYPAATVLAVMAARAMASVGWDAAREAGADGLRRVAGRVTRRIRARYKQIAEEGTPGSAPGEPGEQLSWSPAQLAAARAAVIKVLETAGVPTAQAVLLANAAVGTMVTAP